jgi:hypothetical protein
MAEVPGPAERLHRLARVVETLESLVRQGKDVGREAVESCLRELMACVCEQPPDFDAARRVHRKAGVQFAGHAYPSYTDALYMTAMDYYCRITEREDGYPDDTLEGFLDVVSAASKWEAIDADLSGRLTAPEDLARLITAAMQEVAPAGRH